MRYKLHRAFPPGENPRQVDVSDVVIGGAVTLDTGAIVIEFVTPTERGNRYVLIPVEPSGDKP